MLAFAAAARADVLAPPRNFDERIRTRVVEERGWVADRSAMVAVVLPAVRPTPRTECAFPSRFRDARGAKMGRPLRGATRTPTNWAERVDWHGACLPPHTAEREPR
jgi:hypothetical protein